MNSYPLADLLTRIRNAGQSRHDVVRIPSSTIKEAIVKILKDEGFIKDFKIIEDNKQNIIEVSLKYFSKFRPMIQFLQCVSSPGRRVYLKAREISPVRSGLGIGIFSTPKGILTDKQAISQNIGGEFLAKVW